MKNEKREINTRMRGRQEGRQREGETRYPMVLMTWRWCHLIYIYNEEAAAWRGPQREMRADADMLQLSLRPSFALFTFAYCHTILQIVCSVLQRLSSRGQLVYRLCVVGTKSHKKATKRTRHLVHIEDEPYTLKSKSGSLSEFGHGFGHACNRTSWTQPI